MLYILRYDYVPNILERRGPFREDHLSRIRQLHEAGTITQAGAAGDPPDHAVIVFRTDDRGVVEAFAREDPYVVNGLVPSYRIDPWNVVVGA